MHLPIACKSWHPIFPPRRAATKENVEKNQNKSQESTNANSKIEICVIRMLVGWLVIFRVIIEIFSIHGRVVFKEIWWLVTHFTKKFEYQNQDGRSWSHGSFQVTGKSSCCYMYYYTGFTTSKPHLNNALYLPGKIIPGWLQAFLYLY